MLTISGLHCSIKRDIKKYKSNNSIENQHDFRARTSNSSAQMEHQPWDGLTAAIVRRLRLSKLEVQKAAKEK